MSGVAARLGTPARRVPELGSVPASVAPARDSGLLRLVAFVALAAFAMAHWSLLVEHADGGRALAQVAIAGAGAGALALLSGLPLARVPRFALAAVLAFATLVAGLVAAGLEGRLLLPRHWSQLVDGLDRGLGGVTSISWPYSGPDEWVRLTILLGAPLLLALAAALAFWPARRAAGGLRAAGLVTLLLMYGTAVTEHDPGAHLGRGIGLLVLVAAWLWLPRLSRRDAAACAALVAAAAVIALPVAAKLDAQQPWLDYRSWDWFGGGRTVTYKWDHTYGQLNWPREGTTLLNVKSARPHYWKVESLDGFDGLRWLHTRANDHAEPSVELPARLEPQGRTWNYFEYNPRWDVRFRVTVRALETNLVVGAGTTYNVLGAGSVSTTAGGTTPVLDESLHRGDAYTVWAYVPHPSAAQMRRAPDGYPLSAQQYTTLALPGLVGSRAVVGADAVVVPSRGDPVGAAAADRRLLASPYAGVYRLAQRLTAGQPTAYDAVKAVENELQSKYTYDERPPVRKYPLAAFLLRDRVGYCQQFSGAMALMLRMVGIPARVAAGFAPGSFNRDQREYRVRDLDAHSWVEVYFTGIGWVTFDPTPQAAPASSQVRDFLGRDGGRALTGNASGAEAAATSDRTTDANLGRDSGGARLPWWSLFVGLAVLAVAMAGWRLIGRHRRRRPNSPAALAAAQVRELESALRRLGWPLPLGTTLLALERRLARAAGPAAARYAAALRAHRYDPRSPEAPGAAERRELRTELGAVGGRRTRLAAWRALPPGGPRV